MQISLTPSRFDSLSNVPALQTLAYEKFQSERTEITGAYSDRNNSVILSISRSSVYMESTYTEAGVFDNSAPYKIQDTVIPSPESAVIEKSISEPDLKALTIKEEAMEKYYELIRKEVEYLLKTLSQEKYNILNEESMDSNENLPQIHKGHAVDNYSIYSRQTTILHQNITIEVNSADADYFSPDKTAERIINFALSFYDGGDRQEFAAMIRKAVMKGYHEAMKALGGFLPQESHDTIELVNRAIDDFANSKDMAISA